MRQNERSYLEALVSLETDASPAVPSLDVMLALLAALGNPQDRLSCIHITGSNGKGTTAIAAEALLAECGVSVGTFTSPHLVRLNERIRVRGQEIDDEQLDRGLRKVRLTARAAGLRPTWFETITAVAMLTFRAAGVDCVVLEVGMLGSWDATNVVSAPVAVITTIDLDHTDRAGRSLGAIAREKAGIVTAGATLITAVTDPVLLAILQERDPARLLRVGETLEVQGYRCGQPTAAVLKTGHGSYPVETPLIGRHLVANLLLAVAAVEDWLGRGLAAADVRRALAETSAPGRVQQLRERPRVILDGAHNPAAARALRETVEDSRWCTGPVVLVLAYLRGRELADFVLELEVESFDLVIATQTQHPRGVSADAVASVVRLMGRECLVEASVAAALSMAVDRAGESGLVVVTGSLGLVAPVQAAIGDMDAVAGRVADGS